MSDDKNPESKWSIIRKQILYPWCSVHRGFPPIFDLSIYECPNCSRAVCGACLFVTEDGVLCKSCVKNSGKEGLKPFYDEKLVSEKRRLYAQILLIVFALFYFGGIAFAMLNPSLEEGIILMLLGAGTLIFGYALMLGSYFILFERKSKESEFELSESELKKLDEEIAESVKRRK
ncbi:MAG: hypothetical protein N3F05_02900 [Candidatus Diapherotrites archaeon]|nr:hypothetical protein [Candidatus Diapherotrites archaeon]